MDFFTIVLLALCLASDAFAVSITNGMCSCYINKKNALATALTFGFFQALMPLLGFVLGQTFTDVVGRFQHWIALFLLGAIGINLIVEAIKEGKNPEEINCSKNVFTIKNLVLQGIATSIDALAAGVSLAVMDINILYATGLIGIITFLCCAIGIYIGKKFGSLLGVRARLVGGLILIIIGLKIFIEHQIAI